MVEGGGWRVEGEQGGGEARGWRVGREVEGGLMRGEGGVMRGERGGELRIEEGSANRSGRCNRNGVKNGNKPKIPE